MKISELPGKRFPVPKIESKTINNITVNKPRLKKIIKIEKKSMVSQIKKPPAKTGVSKSEFIFFSILDIYFWFLAELTSKLSTTSTSTTSSLSTTEQPTTTTFAPTTTTTTTSTTTSISATTKLKKGLKFLSCSKNS